MASINLEKVKTLYGNSTDLQGQFIDYLRNVESELDFSKFEGLDDQAIFTNLMESGQKEIKVNPNNPAKPLNYRPRREQTYKELKPLDDELKNQPFYKDLAMRATQVLDQINPTPFRQKELEARRHKAQEILNHLKRSGVTSEQFAKEYGDSPFLREAYFENQDIFSNIFDLSHDISAALFGGKNAQAKAYDFELESYNTYKTIAQRKLDNPSSYYKLSPKERAIIEQRVGAIGSWWRNNSDKELVDHYLDLENAKESASNFVSAQKRLENVNSNEQFLGLIGALKHGKEFDKKQKAMIDDYAIVAKELGFDTLAYNKTGLYFIKDEKAYKVEQGLWDEIKGVFKDNIGSLAGAIAGAEYGYKKGKFKGMVIYGAAGAFGGGVTDSMIADVLANKKVDLAQALIHGAQEGALNIAADAVLKVAGTAIKTLNPEKLKNIAGTAIDYTPLLGFAKRAKDGNKAAAQKLIDHAIPQEAQADLKALESIFGAEVQIGATKVSQAQSAIRTLESKLGSDSYIVKGAKSLYDTFAFTSQKQAQKDFIRAIRADESGNLSAFLSEAANASPVIQKNLLNILDQTSQKLAHQLGRFDLPPSTIKDVFDNFEKGTKQSYTDAIEQILLKVYDESYTTTLAKDSPNIPSNLSSQEAARFNTDSLEAFKAKMEKSGVLLEDSAKFLRFVESTIYNPKGVTFETLNNAQKTLNAYYKQATDPNFRNFVKDAVNGFIKRDIQAGIEKIFAQNAPLYNDARTLFDTALSDYATMKETLKLADSLKIRDRRRSYDQVAQSLSRFFLGQGENIPNFEALLGGLQKELREQVELKLLQDMLELSFVKLNDIKVLDSSEFFKRLEPLKGHFHSTSAKDFIKIAQDFHTLFRNDASIVRSLSPATTEKIGTSIATTLEGAVKFQVIKALFANIIRLMPHIPFAKRLNESVQGSALRYQLKKALDSSLSVGEFKLELQARAIKGDFTNATREQIAKILGQVENAQESLERATTPSTQAKDTLESQASKEASTPNPAETPTQKVDSSVEHFGQNFSEYKGQGAKAVEKVLQERSGQVQGAFYRDELGEIDVVWGEITDPEKHKGYGLVHILDKRKAEFMQQGLSEAQAEAKAIDFTKNEIANIIENGKITNKPNEATKIETPAYKLILKQNWKGEPLENKWVVTAYIKNEKGESISSTPFTKGDNLPLNSSGNSTTLSPLEQAKAQKQAEQAAQEATKLAQRQADQETAQAIKDKNDQIQNLKDSRAGKSEMEREVTLGQPIAMKHTEQPPTSIATDDNNIYQLDFVIVKASDVKPNFNADGLQPRTQKEHKTIESIAQNFKPEMVLGRGGYKDLPIIAKDGQVITGNHRVQGFKDFTTESRAAYEKAIKERFNIELASDELLLRTPSDDLSVKELLSIAYNSNKEDIKNLGDHIYSVLGRYAPNFAKLPRQLESTSVQELKSKIARILDPSPYPDENGANLALLANTIKADKNANITEILNAFSKLDKEDAARTLNTFTDTAGLWHILSNNAVEYGLKRLDLRPYLLGAMYKSAVSQHTTRAANFKELNEQIKHILDTTDASGSNMMLAMMPNTYDNLIADLLGASLARFMRLENPSSNLYEALKGANSGIREQLAPRLDFEIGFTAGRNIEQADIFDFIEYMIREGDKGKEVAEAVELLPKLREKYNAFKASTTPPNTPTPPTPPTTPPTSKGLFDEVDSKQIEKPHNLYTLRENAKTTLAPLINKEITNINTQEVATLTNKGIRKMTSDKAIAKSVANGFEPAEHFKAVEQVTKLFEKATKATSYTDPTDINLTIHRYNAPFENANALLTLKEYMQDGKRMYSLELENLDAIKFNPSGKDLMEQSPKSKDIDTANFNAPSENPSDTIPQKSLMNYTLLDNNLVEAIGQKIFRNYNKPYKERMSEIRDFFTLPKEHFTKILDKYKREVNSLEKGEIYNKIATTMSIDEITDEITRSLKIKRERGYVAQAEKYFNELEEKAFHISKILQDMPYQIRDFIQNSAIDYKAAQWQKLLNTLDRLITRNNEIILENVQIRHKEYVEKFKNLATRNFSLWKNINALLNKEGIREVGDTLEVRNKNILDSIFKQTTPPSTPTPPTQKSLFDTQAPAETPAQKADSSLNQELKDTPKKSQREQVKQQLQSIKNIDITHKSGIVARLSSTGIDKMLSDKAIQKSLDNGFSQEQHFSAVADIERLFKNSDFSHTEAPKNQSADIVGVHRYINSQDLQAQNAQALITLKESIENGNRIYSVELEGLTHPSSVDRSPKSKGVENSHHDDAGATDTARLFENSSDIIPRPTQSPAQKGLFDEVDSSVAYTDTKGHTHQIPSDIAQKWLETFGLKDLQEAYTPQFSEQVAQALEPILQGEQITLSANSLVKLMQRDRLEFLPYIKETLETPNAVVKQVDGAIIFAKDYRDEKLGKFFASVSKNDKGEWIISSNAPKNLNNLHNKIKEGGEVLYSDLPELPIIAKPDLTAKALNSEANQGDIIPQTTQAKQSGKSVAETKELIDKELESINTQKIQEVKEKIKQLNKESRDLAYNAPTTKYLGRGYTKTRDKKYLDYRSRFRGSLKENGIGLDYMELEKLKQDTTLKGKARKEAMDTIYLRMYENMQQADKEAQERARAFSQKIREEELQEANEWLEKNKGASSDIDYEYKKKIAEIDKQLDLAFKKNTKDTEFIDLMNRQKGTLTYAKNGDLGVVRLPEVEKFYPRGYPMDLKVLRDIQKEHNYTDKNLILNGRDFSKSFEVMRAEIEARIGIKPIKEFGTNYAEHYHSGESAIAKLLLEKQGQVAGAFHRKELGDIDLVWGDSSKGLAHILERRKQDFIEKGFSEAEAEQKALEFVKSLPDIIENGSIDKGTQRVFLDTENERAVIALDYNGIDRKWVLTGYIKDDKAPISAYPHQNKLTDSTSSPIVKSALTDEIIPQPPQKSLFDTQETPAETPPPKVDSSEAPPSKINFTYTTGEAKGIAELRKDLKAALEPYKSTPITNKETGLQGVVTDTERNKISSKKAVDKSVANGFSRDEHFTAAQHLKNLFENATKAQSHNDYKQRENIAQVHRFVKDLYINDKPAQAKITLFEKIEGKNRIYTLELESLSPTPQSSPHTQAGVAVEAQVTRDVVRPNANIAKTDGEIIPQSHTALSEQAQDHARQILQGLRKTAQTPLNKLADEVPSTDRKFMIREAKYIKQQAQEFADNFANLRWQDLRSAIRYAKVPYDEAMFKELKESIESREFARFIESSYPHKPTQKSLFDTQELTPPKDTQAPAETPAQKVDSSKITIAQEPTEPKTLSPQEAKELLESKQGQRLPQELDIQSFLKSLESVENKENFIAHLQKKDDAQSRLAYLHIVEPTLKTPDIELTKGERKTKIKVFNDGENFYSFLIADLADKRLFTFLPKARKGYIETKIKNADLIQTFTSQASKDQEPNGLARHSIAQDSNALLESTSTPTPSQPPQAQKLKEALQIPLTDDRGLQSLAFGRVGSDAEIMEQVLIPQARNAYRKGTSQNKLEVAARNTLKKHRQDLEQSLNITPIKEFGTNYAEHYHSGETAIQKLLLEKQGQVAGAFYREGIGDITLAWGEKGTGKSDGWGLAKIAEYHPEVLDKLDKLIQDLPIVKETENRYKLDNGDFFISIRKDFDGEKQNWVLTALERDESIARRRTDLPSSQSEAEKTTSANASEIIPQSTAPLSKQAQEGKSVAENNTNAWQKEFIEKIKNDESGEILGHYTQGEALVIERKINNKNLDLISITKGENGELFTTYLGKFITRQEAQKRKSFLDNGFKGKEKELLEFLEKEPVNIGSERIAFIPTLDKFFGISSFNGEYFTEFFIHKHFADSKEPFTSMSLGQRKLEVAKDNLGRYIDKLFKDNGHPFGLLINNKKTMQRLAKDKELYKVKGKGAIETLLTAKMGHIQGAFHRKELGDIDLVWGDSSFGLAHIIERRMQDFINQGMSHEQAEQAVKELLDQIPQILEGQIYKDSADKVEIITDKYTLVIGKRDDRKFIITELIDRRNGKRMEAMQTRVGDSFTDEPLAKSPLSSNRSDSTTKTFNQPT